MSKQYTEDSLVLLSNRVRDIFERVTKAFGQWLIAGLKKPEPRNWLEKQLRKEAEGVEQARRAAAEHGYLYMMLWRKLSDSVINGKSLVSYIKDAYIYKYGEGVTINIYPTAAALELQQEFEVGLIVGLDMAVVRRSVRPVGSWTQTVEVSFDGPSFMGKETSVCLRSVPVGPSCRIVERVTIEPEHERIEYEVECVEEPEEV